MPVDMKARWFTLPAGGWMYVKFSRTENMQCRFCKKPACTLCDCNLGEDRACEAPLCRGCATSVGLDLDHCPQHYRVAEQQTMFGGA